MPRPAEVDHDRWQRRAAFWAGAIAVWNALLWVAGLAGAGHPIGRRDPYDAIIIGALAWGLTRRNRIAAVVLLTYWVISKVVRYYWIGDYFGLMTGPLFAIVFIMSAQEALTHRTPNALVEPGAG